MCVIFIDSIIVSFFIFTPVSLPENFFYLFILYFAICLAGHLSENATIICRLHEDNSRLIMGILMMVNVSHVSFNNNQNQSSRSSIIRIPIVEYQLTEKGMALVKKSIYLPLFCTNNRIIKFLL